METDWDQRYREEDTPWDKGKPAPGLVDWLSNQNIDSDTRVLVPGCGKGHDAAAWAKAGFETTGMDLSDLALNDARNKYQALPYLAFFPGNFLADIPQEPYDLVFEHTLYCAINPQRRNEYANHCLTGYAQVDISWLFILSFRLPMRVHHSGQAKRKLLPAFPLILN